ncbi:MAG: hypothetical protein NC548_28540 [Lachnospiraceae bacterium]|nr:hypothetical protein [Lachnospiraceae bacterium]
MKPEYFGDIDKLYGNVQCSEISTVKRMFPQERDWTCALACFRTLLKSVGITINEENLIEVCDIQIGPKNSSDVKRWAGVLKLDKQIRYGCDHRYINKKSANLLHELLRSHNVMLEVMLNYAHWIVVLAYYKMGELRDDTMVIYDPYYDKIRLFPAEEILSMWYAAGDNTKDRDFVAILKDGGN